MSIRITTAVKQNATTIKVEGRLVGQHVTELRREFESARGAVSLDLSGLLSVDSDGARELLDLAAAGAKLCNASAYVRQLLRESSS